MNDKFYYSNINIPGNKVCIIKYFEKLDKYGLFLEDTDKLYDYTNKLLAETPSLQETYLAQ